MKIEYHKFWSNTLQQDMEFKIYGHAGKPVLVFPSFAGRFYDYENFGMIGAASAYIDLGQYQFYTVDSLDSQTWGNSEISPAERARRHEDYDRYIISEIVPFIRSRSETKQRLLATGCSMGGYHSANFFFRHPDVFDSLISLSGVFTLTLFIGMYVDQIVRRNSPLLWLRSVKNKKQLDQYRRGRIIICAGQGAWEDRMKAEISAMRQVLTTKHIPAWIDLWGEDVDHDWPWWRKMLPYFLGKLLDGRTIPQTT